MDLRDGYLMCLFCLVAYLYHCIRVIHDELEHKSSTIAALKQTQDDIVKEAEQQKFKLDELRTKISINTDDNLVLREKILLNHHNIKTIDGTFVDLRRNLSSLQNIVESNVGYITVMRKHEMQMNRSIIRTKTENKQQIADLNEKNARLQSDLNDVKDAHVETNAQMNRSIMVLQKNVSSLQNKVALYGATITEMQRHELRMDKSIIKMKTENIEQIEDLKKTIARLQSDHHDVKFAHFETKEQLIQTKMHLRNELLSLQKKVESTEVNIKAIEKENLQRERTIGEMKTEIIRDFKDVFEKLAKHLKDTFEQIIHQIDHVYDVTTRINGRIDELEVRLDTLEVHLDNLKVHQHDTGIVWLIKKGISKLAQIALNFFLGPIAGLIE
ncbi:uncharacterized protein LOC127718387 [Mytilus californianus]|uniref:uncharacterized protein LOC127718387 n=1 Tax=Mytilus californianus TaxID=6549 RepID=UPI002245194F|nr:uncharacterized protein LOC127718387 [Mytilus californianus]